VIARIYVPRDTPARYLHAWAEIPPEQREKIGLTLTLAAMISESDVAFTLYGTTTWTSGAGVGNPGVYYRIDESLRGKSVQIALSYAHGLTPVVFVELAPAIKEEDAKLGGL